MDDVVGESTAHDVIRQLREALDSRVVIEQAKGIVAVQRGVQVSAAFEQLRAEARRRRLSIHLVAAEVIEAHDGSSARAVTGRRESE